MKKLQIINSISLIANEIKKIVSAKHIETLLTVFLFYATYLLPRNFIEKIKLSTNL